MNRFLFRAAMILGGAALSGCGASVSVDEVGRVSAPQPAIDQTAEIILASNEEPAGSEPAADPLDEFDRPVSIDDVPYCQFLIALDKETGKLRWKRVRNGDHAYSTPLLIEHAGLKQIVSVSGRGVCAYEPETGSEIWWCRHDGYSVVPRPVYANGLVYICTGYTTPQLLAIDPSGESDVTDTHVKWSAARGIPFNPSPLIIDDAIYYVNDTGVLTCAAAADGELRWKKRLQGHFSASPVFAGGHLYVVSDEGTTHVVKSGAAFELVASNTIDGYVQASPSVSGDSLLLRTETHLYRIEDEQAARSPAKSGNAAQPSRDWPQFRGPDGQGHAEASRVPTEWSEEKNVVWRTEIPGRGWSSPVVRGDRIWLTTAVENDDGSTALQALCLDRASGRIERTVDVFRRTDAGIIHRRNSHATPTPVIDGDRIFVHFGAHGTACLSSEGEVLWRNRIFYHHHHGPAGSPAIVGGLLVINCDGYEGPYDDGYSESDMESDESL